ncbi:MAG: hypothetical protein LUO93_07750 [Methanomicrobiales archaeon]|nr:hypothetical protein [Methanomicrobiales archaeon]
MTETNPTTTESNESTTPKDRTWILVPFIAFGGVLIGMAVPDLIFTAGTGGCVLASFLLAYLAYRKPKKDIVSLLTPLYAVLIFFNDSFDPTLLLPIQALYAASLTLLVFRLNARFSRKNDLPRKFIEEEEGEPDDE